MSAPNATPLTLPALLSLDLPAGGATPNVLWYTFQLAQADTIGVMVHGHSDLTLFNATGSRMMSDLATPTPDVYLYTFVLSPGTYYLAAYAYSGDNYADDGFVVNAAAAQGVQNAPYEMGSLTGGGGGGGGAPTQYQQITLPFTGQVATSGGVAWLRFDLDARSTFLVSGGSPSAARVAMFYADGRQLSGQNSGSASGIQPRYVGLDAYSPNSSTRYVCVAAGTGVSFGDNFKVSGASGEATLNLTIETAAQTDKTQGTARDDFGGTVGALIDGRALPVRNGGIDPGAWQDSSVYFPALLSKLAAGGWAVAAPAAPANNATGQVVNWAADLPGVKGCDALTLAFGFRLIGERQSFVELRLQYTRWGAETPYMEREEKVSLRATYFPGEGTSVFASTGTGADDATVSVPAAVMPGEAHLLMMRWASGALELFLDGVLLHTTTAPARFVGADKRTPSAPRLILTAMERSEVDFVELRMANGPVVRPEFWTAFVGSYEAA